MAERQGIVDQRKRLLGAAGADHRDGAVIQHPGENILVHLDGFHFRHVEFDSAARQKADLDDDAFGGYREFAAGLANPGRQHCDQADAQNRQPGIAAARQPARQRKDDAHAQQQHRREIDDPVQPRPVDHRLAGIQVLVDIAGHAYSAAWGSGSRFQRSTGLGAAAVSSSRRRGARRGAPSKRAVLPALASSASSRSTWMKRSSDSLDSDSVGSISMAPCATSGKYMVMG